MKEKFYQKTGFKNTILISIPSFISLLGILISDTKNDYLKILFIAVAIVLMVVLVCFVIYFGNQEDKTFNELMLLKDKNDKLSLILAHMENDYKTISFALSAFSEMSEKWSSLINSFANNIQKNGEVSDKAWDKINIVDSICVYCRKVIQQYCNDFDNSKISISFVSYSKDSVGNEWVHMSSHSDPFSIRPRACKKEEKLAECIYHYADLIKNGYSDIEIAINNEEIQRIFKKVSLDTDLSKYTQYIAVPLYCSSGKLLGIFQIVTKNGYIIENDKLKMKSFITSNIIPFLNLIVLVDKIYKGLYINPVKINEEV